MNDTIIELQKHVIHIMNNAEWKGELNIVGVDGYETYLVNDNTICIRPKWISVKDRLPEIGQAVLGYCLFGCEWESDRKPQIFLVYREMHYDTKKWRWQIDCDCSGYEFDRGLVDVKYWMLLPPPPKDQS